MTRYLVTGGAGFIGSNMVAELVKQGKTVRVADNFSTGKRDNLKVIADKIELVEGDLAELDFARHAVRDVDYVLHQAAIPSVRAPDMLGQHVEKDQLALDVGHWLAQADHHGAVVRGPDLFQGAGVGAEQGKIWMALVEIVGKNHVPGLERPAGRLPQPPGALLLTKLIELRGSTGSSRCEGEKRDTTPWRPARSGRRRRCRRSRSGCPCRL